MGQPPQTLSARNIDAMPLQHQAGIAYRPRAQTGRTPVACAACEVSVPLPPATVRFAVLATIVAVQTLLIGHSGPGTLQSLERVAWLMATAHGVGDTVRATIQALAALALGLAPLLLAAALGAAAAWSLRVYSSTPRHVEGLGGPIASLVLGQCALLGFWLWLLPVATTSDAWQYDGYGYTLLIVCVGLSWAFGNTLLLWRVAAGPAPEHDAQERHRLHEIGLRRARELAPPAPAAPRRAGALPSRDDRDPQQSH